MERIKENFGRRIALIGGGIIAILISLVMVASFSVQAKAENGPFGSDMDDDQTPFNNAGTVLTRIVQAPYGSTFEGTFTYTFTKVSVAGLSDETSKLKMPTITNPTLSLKVDAGVIDEDVDEDAIYRTQVGPGTLVTDAPYTSVTAENGDPAGSEYWSWTNDSSANSYSVQYTMDKILPSGTNWQLPGEYIYTVTESGHTGTGINGSSAVYTLHIWVKDNGESATPRYTMEGYLLDQTADDAAAAMNLTKKDPRQGYGNSNTLTPVPAAAQVTGGADYYYRGFTFTSKINPTDETFYLSKTVTGEYPDYGQDFAFTLVFNNSSWTAVSTGIIGVIQSFDGDPSGAGTSVSAVTFTPGAGTMTGSFNLKHNQKIVFDGTAAYSGSTSSKIPSGTTYTYTETGVSNYQASAKTDTATAAEVHELGPGEAGANFTVEFGSGDGQEPNAIITTKPATGTHDNYSQVTNHSTYTPTGFWIDALPYVLMIGIPLAAFIIWMISRRRKINR